ncbi:DUF3951 domain-containing protein [Pontibacillus yanchengensis]|uniref:DUF3951 domain-containing protein n=1 Tax=Pontibacillus yanchengensis Y32 TaxID=1385514 RepID=A0A0A2TQH3_9BACI|nr:DUF3951 domain-containing protein [Pontibacillus yanchengensis]KGP71560.1 hypothetical protein N782_18145 [Pontibacillus yanchengensis Y32]
MSASMLGLASIIFPFIIVILVIIGFYKAFVKKKDVSAYYTPFDEITGQTEVTFHEEQEVVSEEDEDGRDDQHKNKKDSK